MLIKFRQSISDFIKSIKSKISIYLIFYWFLALYLISSGLYKLIEPQNFINKLRIIISLPSELLIAYCTLTPFIEISLGLMLILKIHTEKVLAFTLGLFIFYFIFYSYETTTILPSQNVGYQILITNSYASEIIYWNFVLFIIAGFVYLKSN